MNLESSYILSSEQIRSYQSHGYIFLSNVTNREEITFYRSHIRFEVEKLAAAKDAQGRISDYSKMFTQVTNMWRLNERVKKFVVAKRFAKIAADLMGVNGVRLYHDQALFKPPGGKQTPWHQDQYYWPLDTTNTITMWMPLVDVPKEMGSMSFAAGSHTTGSIGHIEISDTSHDIISAIITENNYNVESFALKAGDATFHAGYTLHSAHPNNGMYSREVMAIIYYADGAKITEFDNEHRKVDRDVFLPGLNPGDIAATELNPLLYQK